MTIQNAPPPQQLIPGQIIPQLPKNIKTLDVDMNCGACGTENKFQARFTKTEPLKPGFKNFPATNKFKCLNCQAENDMTNARNQIEKQFGKKSCHEIILIYKWRNNERERSKKSKNKATDKEQYPSEYNLIFNGIVNDKESDGSNTNQEINELRKVTISISEPKYTYTSSSSVYTPTVTIH